MDCFVHSKQNQLQCDVRCVHSRDKIDQAPLLLTFSACVGGEPGDEANTSRIHSQKNDCSTSQHDSHYNFSFATIYTVGRLNIILLTPHLSTHVNSTYLYSDISSITVHFKILSLSDSIIFVCTHHNPTSCHPL